MSVEPTFIFDSGITQLVVKDTGNETFTVTRSGTLLDFKNYRLSSIEYTLADGYILKSISADSSSVMTFDTSSNPIIVTHTSGNDAVVTMTTVEGTLYKKITYNGSKVQADSAIRDGAGHTISTHYLPSSKCTYQTTAPTSAISDGGVHIVYLTSEPAARYSGYIYFVQE